MTTLWGAWGTATQPTKAPPLEGPGCELKVELEPTSAAKASMSEGIRGLYQRCLFYDFVVVAAGMRFPAHRVALAATSSALRERVLEVVRLAAARPLQAPEAASGPSAGAEGTGSPVKLQAPPCAVAPPGAPGHPELHLEQVGDAEAARALLDYVYGMDSTYNITSDEANRDVLRLAHEFRLSRLKERAARWLMTEGLTTDNVIRRLVDLQEFGLDEQYDLVVQQLVSNPSALSTVSSKAEVVDHPKLLQHLLVQAALRYRGGATDAASPKRCREDEQEWSSKRAKASRKLAHVGA